MFDKVIDVRVGVAATRSKISEASRAFPLNSVEVNGLKLTCWRIDGGNVKA